MTHNERLKMARGYYGHNASTYCFEGAPCWQCKELSALLERVERVAAEQARPEIEQRARVELLNSVVGSLRGYPDCGGDVGVMTEVERIGRIARIKAIEWVKEHVMWSPNRDYQECRITAELRRLKGEADATD